MADLSNVPPEVLKILTHDPPYSPGEMQVLQSYILRPDANPVIMTAFQKLGVMPGDNAGPFHTDLRYPGANPNNQIGSMPPPPQTGPFGWTLDALSGLSGLNPIGSGMEAEKANPRAESYNTVDFPQVLNRPNPGRSADHQITADWAAPIREAADTGFGGLITPGPAPSGGGSVYIPAAGLPGGDSSGGRDSYAANTQPPSSMTSLFGRPDIPQSRGADAIPPGSNTMTQGASLGTPGTAMGEDWKSQASTLGLPGNVLFSPDSAFADVADSQIARVAANPTLMADQLFPDAPITAASRQQWLKDVAMLAEAGLLTQMPNADIFNAKPWSDVTVLQQVEAMNKAFSGQGSQVDPRSLYQEAFSRILNSDANTFEDPNQHGVAGDPENQVSVTNGMLAMVTPFVHSGSQEAYVQRLNRAGMMYISEVAGSETNLSYPEWLKAHGAMDWM